MINPIIIGNRLSKHFTQHVLIDNVPTIGFHGLPTNEKGKTPKTEANAFSLRDSLVKMPEREGIMWFDNGGYQKGTNRSYDSVNLYDPKARVITIYKKQEN